MSDIFYIFGVFYIIDKLRTLYGIFSMQNKNAIDKMEDSLPENVGEMGEKIQQLRKDNSKNKNMAYLSWINIFLFLGWIIVGIAYTEYSHLFVALLSLSLLSVLMPFVMAGIYFSKYKNKVLTMLYSGNIKGMLQEIKSEIPKINFMTVIESFLKIGIASYIIYIHFCINV